MTEERIRECLLRGRLEAIQIQVWMDDPNFPIDTLERLSRHDDWTIRECVAKYEHTSTHLLNQIIQKEALSSSHRDQKFWVARAASRNHNCPPMLWFTTGFGFFNMKYKSLP